MKVGMVFDNIVMNKSNFVVWNMWVSIGFGYIIMSCLMCMCNIGSVINSCIVKCCFKICNFIYSFNCVKFIIFK